jgi:hypothetical protein
MFRDIPGKGDEQQLTPDGLFDAAPDSPLL